MSQHFQIKQGDTGPIIVENLKNPDGSAMDLTGATVRFHLSDTSGTLVLNAAATIVSAATGQVSYAWQVADTATAGEYTREWEATLGSGLIETVPNDRDGYPVTITEQGG